MFESAVPPGREIGRLLLATVYLTLGNPRKPLETFGNLWKPLETFGNLWKPLETLTEESGIRLALLDGIVGRTPLAGVRISKARPSLGIYRGFPRPGGGIEVAGDDFPLRSLPSKPLETAVEES